MNGVEISSETGRRIKVAAWISVIIGLLLFYVFGYFPLLMWIAGEMSFLDSLPDWVGNLLQWTVVPLHWLTEAFPGLESYYDKFIPSM